MDNDIKIEDKQVAVSQRHSEVLLFLNEELDKLQQEHSGVTYNLEEEYAKTKKHKSFFTHLLILFSILVVIGISWGVTVYINHQNEEISINLDEFDSLNLKTLLNSVSRIQEQFDAAIKNKNQLTVNYQSELNQAEAKHEQSYFLIDSLNLRTEDEIIRYRLSADSEYEKEVEEINARYEQLLLLADNEIYEYQIQLDKYDQEKLQQAREQEKAINSERQVQELEKQKLKDDYESKIKDLEQSMQIQKEESDSELRRSVSQMKEKYQSEIDLLDPILSDKKAERIMASAATSENLKFNGKQFLAENEIQDETVSQGFSRFQNEYDNYNYVRSPIVNIPHKNTVPSYIKASENLVNSMGQIFTDTALNLHNEKTDLQNHIVELDTEIDGLNTHIDGLYFEIDELFDEIYDLNGDIDGLNGEITGLNDRIDGLNDKIDDLNDEIYGLYDDIDILNETINDKNAEIDGLNNNIVDLKHQHEEEAAKTELRIEKLKQDSEIEKNAAVNVQKNLMENVLEGILVAARSNAAVISASSKNNIRIYISPKARYLVTEEGIEVEFKSEKVIKGTLVDDGGEYYLFVPAKDKEGNEIEFNLESVTPGLTVKLLAK